MTEPTAITLEQAELILADTPFTQWWGITVQELGPGWATVRLPWRPSFVRPGNLLHGSCFETVADVAMWLAIMTRTGEEPMAVTLEMKTSFLRGARSDLVSRAEILRLGRRVAFGVAATTDVDGQMAAHSTLTYARAVHLHPERP